MLIEKYGDDFKKTTDLIYYSRKLNAILLNLNLLVVYFLVKYLSSKMTALLRVLFYGLNSLILPTGLIAHSEAFFLLLFYFALFLLIRLSSNKEKNKVLAIISALVVGLCAQTKLNGFIPLIFFNLFSIIQLLFSCICSALSFYFLHNAM